ncbi:Olfactory receptor 7C2 [Sciurus carolinensis]|uniref:Olfactory receptor 7C2 n=1 Tax=Sciurus carolinensis TaxID=30640 RepID=A0AA41MJQ8_SCICA|nr:Olfactory receptor 7C2 [Sciurus carolinensis]
METENQTGDGNFILLEFTDNPDVQSLLFGLFLSMYLVTVLGNLLIILATISDSHLPTPMKIPHFFCDLPEVLKLACSDTLINNILVYSVALVLGVFPLTGILFSYSQIFSSILRISSDRGKFKAFSTCGSHLLVVSLFYGTSFGVFQDESMASVMYTIVTPMLNPFIYSLRNREIKVALVTLLRKKMPLSKRFDSHLSWVTTCSILETRESHPLHSML